MKLYTLNSKLLEIEKLGDKLYFMRFQKPEGFEYLPGQYIGITTHPTHRRSYSVFDHDDESLHFLIDTKPAGRASQYFDEAKVGDVKFILGPYGKFAYQKTNLSKVFISTGTGVAPYYPMIKELVSEQPGVKIDFIFGSRYFETEVAYRFFEKFISPNFRYIQCITKPEDINQKEQFPKAECEFSRVTDFVPKMDLDWQNTEFYICGNPLMVEDMIQVLSGLGADKVYVERY
jgi:NAD(P)H-flavin reductase